MVNLNGTAPCFRTWWSQGGTLIVIWVPAWTPWAASLACSPKFAPFRSLCCCWASGWAANQKAVEEPARYPAKTFFYLQGLDALVQLVHGAGSQQKTLDRFVLQGPRYGQLRQSAPHAFRQGIELPDSLRLSPGLLRLDPVFHPAVTLEWDATRWKEVVWFQKWAHLFVDGGSFVFSPRERAVFVAETGAEE